MFGEQGGGRRRRGWRPSLAGRWVRWSRHPAGGTAKGRPGVAQGTPRGRHEAQPGGVPGERSRGHARRLPIGPWTSKPADQSSARTQRRPSDERPAVRPGGTLVAPCPGAGRAVSRCVLRMECVQQHAVACDASRDAFGTHICSRVGVAKVSRDTFATPGPQTGGMRYGSGVRWLAHEVCWVDAQDLSQLAHRVQARRQAALEPLNGRQIDAGALGELTLQERAFGAPVVEGGSGDRRRTRRHDLAAEGTGRRHVPL